MDVFKRGTSADLKMIKGMPRRIYNQLKKLNEGRAEGITYDQTEFEIEVQYKIFTREDAERLNLTRGKINEWEGIQKRNDIMKKNRRNIGDMDPAAKNARKEKKVPREPIILSGAKVEEPPTNVKECEKDKAIDFQNHKPEITK